MKLITIKKALLSFGLVILSTLAVNAQQSLWVGQSYTFDVSSSVIGITANMSWSTSGGYLSLSGSGFYRTITVTQYFSGEATVTCEWDYRLTGSGSYTHTKRQVRIKCRDNQVSIYPTSMTMAQGETQYVTYSHQYDNQYTYSAHAYFQSTNPSIVSVNQHTGELKALKEGVAYINVYSKISSTTPTCKVIVQKVNPTAINIPASLSLEVGETKNLNAVLTPSNAISNLTWHSNDNSISTVTQEGEVTGVHHGNSVITVSTENGLSAKCNVSVNKSQLKLFSNCDDGLYEAGHQLTLSSNVVNAEIFYTTDEADPTINSIKYTKPITLDKNINIKAIAYHNDYRDSDIKEIKIEITHLSPTSLYPSNKSKDNFPDIIPYIEYNNQIEIGSNYDNILFEATGHNTELIEFDTFIEGQKIYFVSRNSLKEGSYKISIPKSAIISQNTQEVNLKKEFEFTIQSNNIGKYISSGDASYFIDSQKNLWGFGRSGSALDKNEDNPTYTPKLILKSIEQIYSNDIQTYSAAIDLDRNLWMWGGNYTGQLGNGTKISSSEPYKVLKNVKYVECDNAFSVYAIKEDNTLWGWGRNQDHEIDETNNEYILSPRKILSDVWKVSSDYCSTFAIRTDGSLWCWGYNVCGQLGTGDKKTRTLPVKIMDGVKKVIAGSVTYILKNDDTLWSCGDNSYGGVGDGLTSDVLTPKKILDNVDDIISSSAGVFCLKNDSSLWAWGLNRFGQLGNGTFSNVKSPIKVAENVRKVTSEYSTAILKNDGTVYVCGNNQYGELCNGSKTNVNKFIKLDFPNSVTDISFYAYRGMAITSDGKIWSWGRGPIGDGTTNDFLVPTSIYPSTTSSIESIEIDRDEINLSVDQEVPIAIKVSPNNAEFSFIWSINNSNIASVTPRGIVRGISEGEAELNLTATDGTGTIFQRNCKINVNSISSDININELLPTVSYKDNCLVISNFKTNEAVKIFNSAGILLKEFKNHGETLSVPIVANNIYIVKIGTSKVFKLIAR